MKKIILILCCCFSIPCFAQTVGLFQNDSLAYNGYTLFAPLTSTNTYLIDNCGYMVNTWSSNYRPGELAYLLENGNLLRACRINSPIFNGGGTGGRIEMHDWDNNLVWSYEYTSSTYHAHHDLEYLPNGNILVLAWEYRSNTEAIDAGRSPSLLNNGLWPSRVVELEPVGTNDANIVWMWQLWDHLVQDIDSTKANYGVVPDHPELVNINYTGPNTGGPGGGNTDEDWQHCNSIDYHPELDQIIINSRNFSEFWIIDHSTTTAEAAGHTGGNSGKGGDVLYRWGNPEAYGRGTSADRKLFRQHDSHWITEGLPDEGKIIIFNNGAGRPAGSYSSIDVITPPMDSMGNYMLDDPNAYGPEDLFWTYTATPTNSFFSYYISGAERLPNGNTLICEGATGRFFEVDMDGNTHWEYINPVTFGGPISQGGQTNGQNSVFRAYRYAPDYPAFDGVNLIPGDPIELNPLPYDCEIYDILIPVENLTTTNDIRVYPNPVSSQLNISNDNGEPVQIVIYNTMGQSFYRQSLTTQTTELDINQLQKGIYFIQFYNKNNQLLQTEKLVKVD